MAESENLQEISALIRAGAATRAWDAFVAAGHHLMIADPNALTLKGRLLKDQARKANGDAAARLYLQSAKAYADAATLRPDTYPLINAATMSLFAGQPDHMAFLAQRVLTMLETGAGAGETAYWHDATRAEALLLLGRQAEAKAAFDTAIMAAPSAWEDRAVTLRQFRHVLALRNEPSRWLADYAPPSSVYFKGMIGISADDRLAAAAARDSIEDARAGFGYGALAAGADLLVAEAVIQVGGELHVILPVAVPVFRQQSVAPYGASWLPRFDRLVEQAATLSIISSDDSLTSAAVDLAAHVAKGAAIENAKRLEGRAIGLELNDNRSLAFDPQSDFFVNLERSAPVGSAEMESGVISVMLGCDQPADITGWIPLTDGIYQRRVDSLAAAKSILLAMQPVACDTKCALRISASKTEADNDGDSLTQVLRMAQCSVAGTLIADATTARAMLSLFRDMWTEPLGELPDTGGAVHIYAVAPEG